MLDNKESKTVFDDILLILIKEKRKYTKVKDMIKKARLWNVSDKYGRILLHYAVESNNIGVTKYLIESGSEIDAQDSLKKTPLMIAIENKHKIIIKILLNKGADLEICDDSDRNTLQLVMENSETMDDDTVQMVYKKFRQDCSKDNIKIFTRLLDAGWPVYCTILLKNTELTKIVLVNDAHFTGLFYSFIKLNFRKALEQTVEKGDAEETCKSLQNICCRAKQLFPDEMIEERYWHCPVGSSENFQSRLNLEEGHHQKSIDLLRMQAEWNRIALDDRSISRYLSLHTKCAIACIVDYLLNGNTNLKDAMDEYKGLDDVYELQRPGIYQVTLQQLDLIFCVIMKCNFLIFEELLLAYLALQETSGTSMAECVRNVIDTTMRTKNYFNFCKRLLDKKVYESVTLFELLNNKVEALIYRAREREFFQAIANFNIELKPKSYYFYVLLERKMKPVRIRRSAADVLSKFINIDCDVFPDIVDTILNYLTAQDVLNLCKLRPIVLPSSERRNFRKILSDFLFRIRH